MQKKIKIRDDLYIGGDAPFALISGPCVIESRDNVFLIAKALKEMSDELGIGFIFKSSFLKDNRSSPENYMGPGIKEGLKILKDVKEAFDIPVLSDVHSVDQVEPAAEVLDVLQIPAFLSQQTSLLFAAGKTGKPINIKKSQFIPPEDVKNSISKVEYVGNKNIIVTERGTFFGYHRLIVDMRSFPIIRKTGYPVIFDITHSVRVYGIPSKDPRGGEREFIEPLGRAGVASGVNGVFIETHPEPSKALSDAASMYPLNKMKSFLIQLLRIHNLVKEYV